MMNLGARRTADVALVVAVAIGLTGCAGSSEPEANPYEHTPTAEAVVTVDSATVTKVKRECEAQLKAVAANSGKEIAGVPAKPYEVVSVTFTGQVEEVSLPYKEVAWEVPLTVVTKTPDGKTSSASETCRFRKLQQDAKML